MHKYFFLISLILIACTDPGNTVIPTNLEKIDQDSKFTESAKKLSPEDKKLLGQYLAFSALRTAFNNQTAPVGLTINEAIKIQKEENATRATEEAKAEAIRQQALQEENAKLQALQSALKIYFVKLGPVEKQNYQSYFDLSLSIENTSGKTLKGYRAGIAFSDQFGKEIKLLTIEENQDVPPTLNGIYPYRFEYNQFDDDTNRLLSMPQDKLKVKVTLLDVIY